MLIISGKLFNSNSITVGFFRVIIVIFLCPSINSIARSNNYLPLLNKIDSCCKDDLRLYPQLYHVAFHKNVNKYNYVYFSGWLEQETNQYYQFLEVTGQRTRLQKSVVDNVVPYADDREILDSIATYGDIFGRLGQRFGKIYCGRSEVPSYFVALWAYKHKNEQLAFQVLSKLHENESDTRYAMNGLGYMYFNEMLYAYCNERNYLKAASFGDHLTGSTFIGFEYRETARELTRQLQRKPDDYVSVNLPDSANWQRIKVGMNRTEQLNYLLDRIHLLNCIQYDQPGGISYADGQKSITSDSLLKLPGNFWDNDKKYQLINPYQEILSMKLSLDETGSLVPRLTDSEFIPAYSYFRDFMCQRTLHKYSWVIEDLIFQITNKHFVDISSFDSLDLKTKRQKIDSIVLWCSANSGISEQERQRNILSETKSWIEFKKLLQKSVDSKDSSITDILAKRFGDFQDATYSWQGPDGFIAEAMFELSSGSEHDIRFVLEWQKKNNDDWVQLWASLFLLKFDKGNYCQHLASLENVLVKCDGLTYYPHAVKLLLQQNEPKAKQLAEGILKKDGFTRMFGYGNDQEILKLLLADKSDSTLVCLTKGLNNFNGDGGWYGTGSKSVSLTCDRFVRAVAGWRDNKNEYKIEWSLEKRQDYCRTLSAWLTEQYGLLKEGKRSAIKPEKD